MGKNEGAELGGGIRAHFPFVKIIFSTYNLFLMEKAKKKIRTFLQEAYIQEVLFGCLFWLLLLLVFVFLLA